MAEKKNRLSSLTVKLMLFAFVPVSIVAFLFIFQVVRYLNSQIAIDVKNKLDRELNEFNRQLEFATNNKILLAKKTAFFVQTLPRPDTNALINLLANNLYISRDLSGSSLILKNNKNNYSFIRCFNINNEIENKIIGNLDSAAFIKRFPEAKDILIRPQQLKQGVWSKPYHYTPGDTVLIVSYAEPVYRNGIFKGVVTVDITLNNVAAFFNRFKMVNKYHQEIYLENNESELLYSDKHPELIGESLMEAFIADSVFDRETVDSLFRYIKNHKEGELDVEDSENREHYIFFRASKIQGWRFIASAYHKDIMKLYKPFLIPLILILIAGILTILAIVMYVSNKLIVEPLERMSRTTQKISNGDYSYQVKIKRNDEIGLLADNFRLMVKNLKEREEKLKQKNIELEEANKKLRELDKAKSQFLKLISHEIRTPLNGIIGSTYFLSDMNQDESLKEFIEMLRVSVDRLERVATNSLFVTQLNTGAYSEQCVKLRTEKLVESALEKLKNFAAENGVEINTDIKEKFILACENVAQKAIFEVVHNAVKFSEDKKVDITTRFDDQYYTVTVTNTGKEIPEEKINKLTEPFGMAEDHMDNNFGLGLSIVKMCMDITKGKITVENDKGKIKVELSFEMV